MQRFRSSRHLPNIFEASRDGDIKSVKALLKKREDPDKKDENGFNALHVACENGRVEIVKLLLRNGFLINAIDKGGRTPLYLACRKGEFDVVSHLLEKRAKVNLAENYGYTPLCIASENSDLNIVRLLIEYKAEVNAARNDGWTPLHLATYYGKQDVVLLLLEKGAEVNQPNQDGWTPLYTASSFGHLDVVKLLLKEGADIHLTEKNGHTALYYAKDSVKKGLEKIFDEHEKGKTKEREVSNAEVKRPATKSRSVQTEDLEEELPAGASGFNESLKGMEAILSSLRTEIGKFEREIEKLKRKRSEISGSSETRTPEISTASPSRKDIDEIVARERELVQLTETLSKVVASLLAKEKTMKTTNISASESHSQQTIIVYNNSGGSVTINPTLIEQSNQNVGSHSGQTNASYQNGSTSSHHHSIEIEKAKE